MVIYAPFEADRTLLGTMEYGTPSGDEEPMSLDELRESLARVLGTELPVDEPPGPGTARAAAYQRAEHPTGRTLSGWAGSSWSATRPTCTVAMGGPGLNLGLQDVFNLGWKLAAVVKAPHPMRCSTPTRPNVFRSASG